MFRIFLFFTDKLDEVMFKAVGSGDNVYDLIWDSI